MSNPKKQNRLHDGVEAIIFDSKWILVPFYLGLILAQILYCIKFIIIIVEMVTHSWHISEAEFMYSVLSAVDVVMIANLLKMIISGSYQTFVDKIDEDHSEKISSSALKVKMGSSLVGISSIHLLQSFIHSEGTSTRELVVKCSIHLIFLVSTMGLALVSYLHEKEHQFSHGRETDKLEMNKPETNKSETPQH
jgi:uncharacterized protein (TIGR00645 family)